MLDFAVEHITAINTITADRDMRKYKLSEDDWEIARRLRDVLNVCNLLFLFLHLLKLHSIRSSRTQHCFFPRGTPSIATVIPAMDHIDEHLATATTNHTYPLAVKAALAIGKKTLICYYNQTDHSNIYRIAMSKFFYITL
jgi:hypothetical protein